MGTGWRRAFCTTIPRDREGIESDAEQQNKNKSNQVQDTCQIASPRPVRSGGKLGIFSSISNPSTPRFHSQPVASPTLRCRTTGAAGEGSVSADNTPRLLCKPVEKKPKSPIRKLYSNPSSPRSPFSILKSTLRLSKSGCGVCLQSVKTGQGMAIYTAECGHSFHFPCIADRVRKQGSLICPVCNSAWKDVPLLSVHKKTHPLSDQDDVVVKTVTASSTSEMQSSITAVKTNHEQSRPFNDDEPFLFSAAGTRFNPIPEAEDEDNEDDVEEFQGFFVNPTPSSIPTKNYPAAAFVHGRRTQRNVDVKLLPEAAGISAGRSHEIFTVALRVTAPPPPPLSADGGVSAPPLLSPSNRAPIDLVTVLDVSGSMTSAKLHMLKRAMRLVISSLRSSDRLSIVAFSSSPQRLLPLRRMSHQGQRLARKIIDRLSIGDGKSVSQALKIAGKVLDDRREKNPVASIILLSDGQDQSTQSSGVGQRLSKGQVSNCTRFGHIEIPVNSLGLGGGSGSSYNNQDSVADAFAKCVGGLLSVVVQDLRLQLGFSSGSAPGEISAVYSVSGRPSLLSTDSIRLGDLYAEEERELLVELRVPTSAIGAHHVMTVRCSYRDPATGEVMYARERALLVPRPQASRSTDSRIRRLRNVFLTTRAVAETRRLVEVGEFSTAEQLLVSARALVAQSSAGSSEEYVRWLEAELAALQYWRRQSKVQHHQQEAAMDLQQRRRMGEQHVALVDENGDPLTPTSAWRAAEQLAKVAMLKKSLNRSGDLHGFENARF